MGSSGDRPRKRKHRLAKVPKYEEVTNIQMAGLAENSSGVSGTRLGHSVPHARSQDTGRFGKFILRCLGRRTSDLPSVPTPEEMK